jgi:Cu-Zn family superoxide dismutase
MKKAAYIITRSGHALLVAAVVLVSFALTCSSAVAGEKPAMAKAKIIDASGKTVGVAVLTEGDDGVWIAFNLQGLPPGVHAFHIHAAGKCEPPFKSAMGHFNPFGRKHGLKNPEGAHAGDLPNILVGPDGTLAGVRLAPLVTLGEGKNSLFQPEGTAIVIHQDPDDYMTDPAGAAGPRIACGVITKVE